METTDSQLATIIERLTNVQGTLVEIKKFNEKIDDRATTLEVSQSAIQTKISLFAGMQGVFSVVVGAIATYLGGQR